MGKGASAKMQVVDYRLSIHFGVCLGQVDYFRRIRINEKTAWQGHVTTLSAVSVNNAYLFGGPQKEGGIKGTLHFLPGAPDQLLPAALASKYGKTPETVVAYRGISTIYFTGESAGQGFMWGSNNPIVAQTVDVDATRMATGLDPALAQINNPEFPEGPDTNPAHIIFEAMTDPDDGSMLPEDMGYASFNAAAQTLADEEFGLSLLWTKPMKVEDFVNEIQGHINAVTYADPETGLMDIKLIRDDYNPLELFEINSDNAKLVDFERRMLGETTNEIVVSYTNPRNEEETSITVQDLATAQTQGPISDTRNFYGIRRSTLAEQVGWRELRTVNAPLATVNVLMNREGWNLRPGQPVRVYFPDEINPDRTIDIIARVGEIEYGEPGSEDIPIALTEDVFSLSRPVSRRGEGSGWVDPSDPPTPMVAQQVFTLPTYMVLSANYQDRVVDLEYPEVLAGVLGHHNSYDALSFDLVDSEVQPTGEQELTSAGTKTLTERGSLLQSLAPEASSEVLLGTLPLGRGPRVGGFVLVGAVETGQEIMLITGYDGFQYTVDRGVLDTVPRSWPNGTPAWYINPNSRFIDDRTVRSAGEDVTYYLLPRTSLGQLDIDDATPVSGVLTARPHLPLRPANVMANGVPISGAVNVSTADDIVLTWATRNRLLEDGQVVAWDAAPVAPEYKQRTIVLVSDTAGNEIRRYVHLWTENTFTLPKAWFARWAEVRVYVFAEREELTSLQVMRFDVTGLANNPAAALPPPAPEAGTPPPPVAAPEPGQFTVTGGYMQDVTGAATIPALFVQGRRSNPKATGLVVRYAVAAGAPDYDWQYTPTIPLDERELYLPITAVAPNTTYRVEVAYIEDGVVGYYLHIGDALTGRLVANDAESLNGQSVDVLLDRIASAEALAESAEQKATDLEEVYGDTVSAAQSAIEAGEAAELSVIKATEAEDAATASNVSAGIASTKADEAGASAIAADASQLLATAGASSSKASASLLFPAGFDGQGSFFYRGTHSSNYAGRPDERGDPDQFGAVNIVTDAVYGNVWRISGENANICTQGTVDAVPGRVYEITAEWNVSTAPTQAGSLIRLYMVALDAAWGYISTGTSAIMAINAGTTGRVTHSWRWSDTAATGRYAWTANAAKLRPLIQGAPSIYGGVFDLIGVSVREVSSQATAEAAATASVTSASQAAASAGDAEDFATASEGSATQAATRAGEALTYRNQASDARDGAVTASVSAGTAATAAQLTAANLLPSTFNSSGSYFFATTGLGNNAAGSPEVRANPSQVLPINIVSVPGAGYGSRFSSTRYVMTQGVVSGATDKMYEVTADFYVATAPTGGASGRIDCESMNADYTHYDGASGNAISFASGVTGRVQFTSRWKKSIASGPAGMNNWGINAVWLRFGVLINNFNGLVADLVGLTVREISATVTAEVVAATAVTQASSASASAASAAISASVAASLGTGAGIVKDPTFQDWPVGQALPSNAGTPVGGVAVTRQTAGVIYGTTALRMQDSTLANGYVPIAPGSPASDNTHWVCEYQITVNSGDLRRVGAQLRLYREGGGYYVGLFDIAAKHPSVTAGATYRDSVMLQVTPAGSVTGAPTITQAYFYTNLSSFSGGAFSAKNITLHMLQFRPATAEEVASGQVAALSAAVTVTQTAVTNLETRMATARFEVIAAAGGNAAQLVIRADTSSSVAGIVASAIRFTNVVNGTLVDVMRLVGGNVFITGKLYIGGAPGSGVGYILLDGPNMRIDMYDESNVLKMRIGKLS